MGRYLLIGTDLPYFPGKNGHDFFNLKHLATSNEVGVIGPLHPHHPAEGIANLERTATRCYFWPRAAVSATCPPGAVLPGEARAWLSRLPRQFLRTLLHRLIGLPGVSEDAYLQSAVFNNLAPQLLGAMMERRWSAILLLQSSTAPWLRWMPGSLALATYFHDIRSDYLNRRARLTGDQALLKNARVEAKQERRILATVDAAGFVSELDRARARAQLSPKARLEVARIPIDSAYFTPRPADWPAPTRPVVLFTGHLSHPPNVDAVLHFLDSIWPLIHAARPDAVFQCVGCLPAAELRARLESTPGAELHPDVPDIRPFFWSAACYVVPMRFGGGVRQKILEAWCMRVPVVSTTMGMEGITLAPESLMNRRDAPAAFSETVLGVLDGRESAENIEQRRTFVLREHSAQVAGSEFERLAAAATAVRRSQPFHLLFDLRWMRIGEAGGVEQHAYEHIHALSRLDYRNDYTVLAPRRTLSEWDFPSEFKVRRIPSEQHTGTWSPLRFGLARALAATLGTHQAAGPELAALARLRRLGGGLVHSFPCYIHPDLEPLPHVVTFADLQHLHFPQFFTAEKWRERDDLYRRAAERAEHLLCISEFTRQDVHRHYGVPLERMSVVWHGPSRSATLPMTDARADRLLAALGILGPFLLFPAHHWPHKNHARLLEALSLVRSELPRGLQLVCTGGAFPADHPAFAVIERERLHPLVRQLDHVSPVELRALYHRACALVFPSLFEGFGMPIIEAMSARCPVVCSNSSSLPEVAGDAALYFDPTSTNDIASALLRAATSPETRSQLVEAGTRRVRLFSWRKSAIQTLSVYQTVHQRLFS